MILEIPLLKLEAETWRDSQSVAITQQDTTTALAYERTVPISTIPRQIFSIDQRCYAIGLLVVEDDCINPKVFVGNNDVVDDMMTGIHQLESEDSERLEPPSLRITANEYLSMGIYFLG